MLDAQAGLDGRQPMDLATGPLLFIVQPDEYAANPYFQIKLVLIANDAAGEGVNLQRAHLMVNYDLPWNPNRLEQRFGRIHRIGQTEVCHLWNLIAGETREGQE